MTEADDVAEMAPAPLRPVEGATARVEAVDIHPPTRLERSAYGAIRGAFALLAKPYFRLEIHGREHVPTHGPFVLAPVHRSNLDFILVSALTRTRMRYMGKASIWKWRLGGKFVSMLGAFPVHRGSADREALRTCLAVIENGEPLVMFPEGTRRSGPVVENLFDGPGYIAARTGAPLVPVGIGGSNEAMPVGAKLIRPHRIVLVVGEPIAPPPGDGTGRVRRRVVRELTERLRVSVQAVYDEARRLAG
jgi:1-acyl-sn-glycerol-3-phosphate acyltransferase